MLDLQAALLAHVVRGKDQCVVSELFALMPLLGLFLYTLRGRSIKVPQKALISTTLIMLLVGSPTLGKTKAIEKVQAAAQGVINPRDLDKNWVAPGDLAPPTDKGRVKVNAKAVKAEGGFTSSKQRSA